MFFARPWSTSSSMAPQVSWKGTLATRVVITDVRPEFESQEHTEVDLLVITPPLGRVTVVRVDILERDGEVHEEEVEVVDAPETELLLCQCMHLMTSVSTALAASWRMAHTCSRAWKVFQSCNSVALYQTQRISTHVAWQHTLEVTPGLATAVSHGYVNGQCAYHTHRRLRA